MSKDTFTVHCESCGIRYTQTGKLPEQCGACGFVPDTHYSTMVTRARHRLNVRQIAAGDER